MMTFRAWRKQFEATRHVKLSMKGGQLEVKGDPLSTQDLALAVGNQSFLTGGHLDDELTQAHTEAALSEMGISRITVSETYDAGGRVLTSRTAFTHDEGDERLHEILLSSDEQRVARLEQLAKERRVSSMWNAWRAVE
jgi:hypothetical protein